MNDTHKHPRRTVQPGQMVSSMLTFGKADGEAVDGVDDQSFSVAPPHVMR
jgi:hypothetical protein